MAVVRITGTLINSVLNNVKTQFDAALKAAEEARPEIGQEVYDVAVGPYMEAIMQLPKELFNNASDIYINLPGPMNGRWKLNKSLPVPFSLPSSSRITWSSERHIGVVATLAHDDARFAGIYKRMDAWRNITNRVLDERSDAISEVGKILNAFATLAPALKAWPALWSLLPSSAREHHSLVVTRTKAEPLSIDLATAPLDKLTAKLVTARIAPDREV